MNNQHRFITVIGNIASGKSTITRLLAQSLNAELVQADEFYKTNPFFQDAVVDRSRWSLASDIWFLMKRVEMAKQIETLLATKDVVQDSGLLMSWVYANSRIDAGYMNSKETELYNMLFTSLTQNIPKEHIVIFLNIPVEILKKRIVHRNRDFEIKHHSPTYLDGLAKSLALMVQTVQAQNIPVLEYNEKNSAEPQALVLQIIEDITKGVLYD